MKPIKKKYVQKLVNSIAQYVYQNSKIDKKYAKRPVSIFSISSALIAGVRIV